MDSKNNPEIYNSLPLEKRNIILVNFEIIWILEFYRRKIRDKAGKGNENEWKEAGKSEDRGDN